MADQVIVFVGKALAPLRYGVLRASCKSSFSRSTELPAIAASRNFDDIFTMCVDYLTAILPQLACRKIPSSHRYEEGELRVIAIGNVGIVLRMLSALQTIASLTASPSQRRAFRVQVQSIAELAERTIESSHDRSRFDSAWRVCAKLSTQSQSYSEGQKR